MKGRYFTRLSSYIAMAEVDVLPEALNAAVAGCISESMCKDSGNSAGFAA